MSWSRIGAFASWLCIVHCLGLPVLSLIVTVGDHTAHSSSCEWAELLLIALACGNAVWRSAHIARAGYHYVAGALALASAIVIGGTLLGEEAIKVVALVELGLTQVYIEYLGLCHHDHTHPAHTL